MFSCFCNLPPNYELQLPVCRTTSVGETKTKAWCFICLCCRLPGFDAWWFWASDPCFGSGTSSFGRKTAPILEQTRHLTVCIKTLAILDASLGTALLRFECWVVAWCWTSNKLPFTCCIQKIDLPSYPGKSALGALWDVHSCLLLVFTALNYLWALGKWKPVLGCLPGCGASLIHSQNPGICKHVSYLKKLNQQPPEATRYSVRALPFSRRTLFTLPFNLSPQSLSHLTISHTDGVRSFTLPKPVCNCIFH